MAAGSPLVHVEAAAGGAVVTLDSPANRNALSRRLLGELGEHLDRAAADPSVRAVAITGTGRTFCAGADLADPPVSDGPGSIASLLWALVRYPKPVVIAVNGHVRAGGLGLVAAGDVVLCDPAATFAFSEVRLGLAPAMISVLCLRRMPELAARRYMLTGETFGPEAAVAAGLVTSVTGAGGGALADETRRVLGGFGACEPKALAATRELLLAVPDMDAESGMAHARAVSERFFSSPEAAEGIAAFREKRPPAWAAPAADRRQ